MKVPGTKLVTSTDLGAKADGSYLFYSKSAAGGSKKGFGDTALFTEKYRGKKADGTFANNASITLAKEGANALSNANLASVAATTAAINTNGYKFTVTAVLKPAATTDFFTNGLKYSAAAMSMSQNDANAAAGILYSEAGAGKTLI